MSQQTDIQDTSESPDAEAEQRAREAKHNEKSLKTARKLTGWTRFIAGVPAIGLFIAAVVLAVTTFIEMIEVTLGFLEGGESVIDLATEYIEFADIFLLAVVLYIMALGLFTLFVSDKIPLPQWLEFHDFDDLKERLVSVICVMLGVMFLGVVMKGASGVDLLWLGLGTSIIIVALTLFVKLVIKGKE